MPSCTFQHPLPSGQILYITLTADSHGLLSIHLDTNGDETECGTDFLKNAKEQIISYLHGKRREFDLPISSLATRGATEFQRDVWAATSRIPYGETGTYGQIALQIGRPNSARAVGNALGKNPLPLIVPCHRVLSSSGMGGFSGGGPEVKEYLLAVERGEKL